MRLIALPPPVLAIHSLKFLIHVYYYSTRFSTKDNFYVEQLKLENSSYVWNALPSDFQNLSKFIFQKKLKFSLLELLIRTDDCI